MVNIQLDHFNGLLTLVSVESPFIQFLAYPTHSISGY